MCLVTASPGLLEAVTVRQTFLAFADDLHGFEKYWPAFCQMSLSLSVFMTLEELWGWGRKITAIKCLSHPVTQEHILPTRLSSADFNLDHG